MQSVAVTPTGVACGGVSRRLLDCAATLSMRPFPRSYFGLLVQTHGDPYLSYNCSSPVASMQCRVSAPMLLK